MRAPKKILGRSKTSRHTHIAMYEVLLEYQTFIHPCMYENEGCRAKKIVDDSGFDSGFSIAPISTQARNRAGLKRSDLLLKKSLSELRFHIP